MGWRSLGRKGDLVAIDPGGRGYAAAFFRAGELRSVGWFSDFNITIATYDVVIAEVPRHRPRSRVRVNDLIDLALTSGRASAAIRARVHEFVTPQEWKGSRTKDVDHRAIWKSLHPSEALRLEEALRETTQRRGLDLLDAAGIGLWALDRKK